MARCKSHRTREATPMPLPPEMVVLLAAFAPLFSDRVWAHAQILAIGAILATGKRTVTSAWRIMGLSHEAHFTNYHRVLNRAAWCPRAASRILLGLIVLTLVPADWPIVLVADDTVERRHGRKIQAKGCYRDAVRSSRKVVVKCFGLKWVAMMVLVPLPWNKRVKALPFLTVLGWPESAPRQRAHKTAIDGVKQMVLQVRRWFPQRRVVLVLDGGFAAVKRARACRRHGVTMICRLRLDAGLYDPPGVPPNADIPVRANLLSILRGPHDLRRLILEAEPLDPTASLVVEDLQAWRRRHLMLLPPRMLLPHLDAGPRPPITTAPVQPTREARLRQRLGARRELPPDLPQYPGGAALVRVPTRTRAAHLQCRRPLGQ